MVECLEWVIVTTSQRPVAQRKGEGYVRPGNNSQVQTPTNDWRCGSDMVDGGSYNHVFAGQEEFENVKHLLNNSKTYTRDVVYKEIFEI